MINTPVGQVWEALVNPDMIKQYMFGTNVVTDWKEGSPIVWQGEWQGKAYEDKVALLKIEPERILQYSHFSPLGANIISPPRRRGHREKQLGVLCVSAVSFGYTG